VLSDDIVNPGIEQSKLRTCGPAGDSSRRHGYEKTEDFAASIRLSIAE
jgi:hypothetical protein